MREDVQEQRGNERKGGTKRRGTCQGKGRPSYSILIQRYQQRNTQFISYWQDRRGRYGSARLARGRQDWKARPTNADS